MKRHDTNQGASHREARTPAGLLGARGLRVAAGLLLAVVTAALWLGACSASSGGRSDDDDNDDGSGGSGGFTGLGGSGLGVGGGMGGNGQPPPVAFLNGTVFAPEGTIPISGALVYAVKTHPDPIPQQVYCDECVNLSADTAYVLTEPNGTFSLGVPYLGDWKLVVQKGGFRKVRGLFISTEGQHQMDPEHTTLPGKSVPQAGDDIPKIAVALGSWDSIEDTLGKLGLGEVDTAGNLIPGSQSFDLFDGNAAQLFTDWNVLSQYHIVFFPCTTDWLDGYLNDPAVLDRLRQFVLEGGKLYTTDYSYDVLRRFNPDPIKWLNDYGGYGDAETGYSYDAPATVNDPGLADWLAAQGITSFSLEDNWTIVDHVEQYTAPDESNTPEVFDPTVWVSGQVPSEGLRPMTISYQYGCGRALFSTYHTEAWGVQSLMTQERALLYIILEVSVCIGDYPPPPN